MMTRTVAPTTDPMINHLLSSSGGSVVVVKSSVVTSVVVGSVVVILVVDSDEVNNDVISVVMLAFVTAYPGSDDTELTVALKSSTANVGSSVVDSNSCKKVNQLSI